MNGEIMILQVTTNNTLLPVILKIIYRLRHRTSRESVNQLPLFMRLRFVLNVLIINELEKKGIY